MVAVAVSPDNFETLPLYIDYSHADITIIK